MTAGTISGDLTLARTQELLRDVRALATAGAVDLAGVTRVDSAGLAFLLEVTRLARRHGKDVILSNPPPAVRSLATFFGLSGILRFEDYGNPS